MPKRNARKAIPAQVVVAPETTAATPAPARVVDWNVVHDNIRDLSYEGSDNNHGRISVEIRSLMGMIDYARAYHPNDDWDIGDGNWTWEPMIDWCNREVLPSLWEIADGFFMRDSYLNEETRAQETARMLAARELANTIIAIVTAQPDENSAIKLPSTTPFA